MSAPWFDAWKERRKQRRVERLRDEIDDQREERDRIELFTGWPHHGPPSRLRKANERLARLEAELRESHSHSRPKDDAP